MSGNFLQWGIPALATVAGGTVLTIAMTGANIASDLSNKSRAALASDTYAWAELSLDGREVLLSGTAADQKVVDAAVARVAAIHGVAAVRTNVVVAPLGKPFPFAASIVDGDLALAGGVPDETAHAELLLATGATRDDLRLMAGAPPRAEWRSAIDYGLAHLAQFDRGEIALADLKLNIAGRAKSSSAFNELALLQHGGAPTGVELGAVDIEPPLVSPYEWQARFDGKSVAVSGLAPNEAFVERIRDVAPQSVPVSTSLVLASGAPESFEETAALLLTNLLQLEAGTAIISDSEAILRGAPANELIAQAVTKDVSPTGATVALDPPRVGTYEFTATRRGDVTILDGFVPDAATKARLEALEGIDASSLELARGAPARFASAVEFGLDILSHLSEGRVAITGTVLAVDGRAATVADFDALQEMVVLGAPQGLTLARADVKPPRATSFTWSAQRAADGKIVISGFVPSQAVRKALQAVTPALGGDGSTLADGGPPDFEAMAKAGLALLPLLDTGEIAYDGVRWSLSGAVDSAHKGFAAEAAFAAAGLRASGWTYDVRLPRPAEPAALPIIDPYLWRAQKRGDGSVTFSGFAPTEAFRQLVARRAGGAVTDESSVGAGYPQNFIAAALAGFDALLQLDAGALGFADGAWTLSGRTETGARRAEVQQALAAAVDRGAWQIDIEAGDVPPVATPYIWSATKGAGGAVALAGHVPTPELQRFAAIRAGSVQADTTSISSGAPPGFIADVLAGLDALTHLRTGAAKFDGGKWTLSGVPQTAAQSSAALAALSTASNGGIGWETAISPPAITSRPEPETAVEPAPIPAVPNVRFEASKTLDGPIDLKGQVPADATRRYFGVIAGNVGTGSITIGEDLPADFIPSADAGLRALVALSDGHFSLDGDKWVLRGRAATEAEREAILASLDAIPQTKDWQREITLLPPIEICRRQVAAFAGRNAIIFQSGSTRITDASAPALDELALYLLACPEAIVDVEGHTDSDGAEDPNLALSVARAEAVAAALIERGIGANRLYAIGYGESLPVADNGTSAGKQANRRIAFTLREMPQ